jgi:hypothetical protein
MGFEFFMVVNVKPMSSGPHHQAVLQVVMNISDRPAASLFSVEVVSTI